MEYFLDEWIYFSVSVQMMGTQGLKEATQMAMLSANYMNLRLSPHYKTLYTQQGACCSRAHPGHQGWVKSFFFGS